MARLSESLHADGLLVPGSRRVVPAQHSPRRTDPGAASEPAGKPATTTTEPAPELPRRRRASSGQPRRPRPSSAQLDRAALLRLLRPGTASADED